MQENTGTPMIEVEDLTKYYGEYPAIEGISFTVNRGEILGFLGPNAAGKTTTMRILTGFMPPTSGTARIAGYDVVDQSLEVRRHIGYLPETVPLYTEMSVTDYLDFMGRIRGMDKEWRSEGASARSSISAGWATTACRSSASCQRASGRGWALLRQSSTSLRC